MTSDLHPAEVLDAYLHVCTDSSTFVEQFVGLAKQLNIRGPVLDCAVGTGFGTIELLKLGHSIVCSDGSAEMLKQFSVNSDAAGVPAKPSLLRWNELARTFPQVFELIMCRGNSLAYADAWDSHVNDPSDFSSLVEHLSGMYGAIKPGGYLFVDFPVEEGTDAVSVRRNVRSGALNDARPVEVVEVIEANRTSGQRVWSVVITISDSEYTFERVSRILGAEQLTNALLEAGFSEVRQVGGSGIRKHYDSLVAVRGAHLASD